MRSDPYGISSVISGFLFIGSSEEMIKDSRVFLCIFFTLKAHQIDLW